MFLARRAAFQVEILVLGPESFFASDSVHKVLGVTSSDNSSSCYWKANCDVKHIAWPYPQREIRNSRTDEIQHWSMKGRSKNLFIQLYKCGSLRTNMVLRKTSTSHRLGEAGFEPESVTDSDVNDLQKTENSSAAESGALNAKSQSKDPDLALLIKSWPVLSASEREAIMKIVRAARR